MKKCKGCGEDKPLSEYYKHKAMADGHLNKCKDCVKGRVKTHRSENLERIQEYDRNRPNKEERHEKNCQRYRDKRKQADPEWLAKDTERAKKYRHKHPDKYKVTNAVNNAVRDGTLLKPSTCSKCPATDNIQGHHHSYAEADWLDVEWLCTKCHSEEHS